MICLSCGHYIVADREMAREQRSDVCTCECHRKYADFEIAPDEMEQIREAQASFELEQAQIRMLHARVFAGAINTSTADQWLDDDEAAKLRALRQ